MTKVISDLLSAVSLNISLFSILAITFCTSLLISQSTQNCFSDCKFSQFLIQTVSVLLILYLLWRHKIRGAYTDHNRRLVINLNPLYNVFFIDRIK